MEVPLDKLNMDTLVVCASSQENLAMLDYCVGGDIFLSAKENPASVDIHHESMIVPVLCNYVKLCAIFSCFLVINQDYNFLVKDFCGFWSNFKF